MKTRLLGHEKQRAQLDKAIAAGTLAATYLFEGPEGVGKMQIAMDIAKRLICSQHQHNLCPTCARIAEGLHPDVIIVAPDPARTLQEISIDQIRTLQSRFSLHALESSTKIAIIDQADRMHIAAANAALKILEEPPQATHFFLISSQPDRLLPTIRSRAQRVTFGPLSTDVILRELEASGIEPAEARQRALLSDGSLGRAIQYPIETFTETMGHIHEMLTQPKTTATLDCAEIWASDAALLPWRLQLVALLWRDALAQQAQAIDGSSLPATQSLIDAVKVRPRHRLAAELDETLRLVGELRETTLNKQLFCESLLSRLAA
jgi:DNA polymerase III subunit delta'